MKENILIFFLQVVSLVVLDIILIKELQVALDVRKDIHQLVIQLIVKYVKLELFQMIII